MAERIERVIACEGVWGLVEYAVRANGAIPARDYFLSLDDRDQAKTIALAEHLSNEGSISNEQKLKHERDKIFGFKPTKHIRFPCFRIGKSWILTHGFKKEGRKWREEEFKRAFQIMEEHRSHFSEYGEGD